MRVILLIVVFLHTGICSEFRRDGRSRTVVHLHVYGATRRCKSFIHKVIDGRREAFERLFPGSAAPCQSFADEQAILRSCARNAL